jgi:hypothetical protein
MVADMSDKVFGLSVNQVMAYAATANVMLVLVLTTINIYYAWLAKRQADASSAQVDSSNRQREIAAETLSILRKQIGAAANRRPRNRGVAVEGCDSHD